MVAAVIHDLNLAAAFCDHLLIMKDGRLFAQGRAEAAMTAEIIEEVFQTQAEVGWNGFSDSLQISYRYFDETRLTQTGGSQSLPPDGSGAFDFD
jgi:ABC-type cobalamin/Fe3+-siderophores transport system ATPase subunit